MIQPLDWPQLVAEAHRRRKAEGLTQQAHADLAGVSKPVIIAFDRGETTLSLGRALAILKVVGLVEEGPPPGSHAAFVAAAQARWRELVADLPVDDPARHPLGGYEVDYEIAGAKAVPDAESLLGMLNDILPLVDIFRVQLRWLPFWISSGIELNPVIIDKKMIECWQNPPGASKRISSPADPDFWRLSTTGNAYWSRGFEEDDPSLKRPGAFFDITSPIQSAILVMLHAANFAKLLTVDNAPITIQARYRGLAHRELASFSDPSLRDLIGSPRSLSDTATLSIQTNAEQISSDLSALVHRFLSPLYTLFDGFQLERSFVQQEVMRLTRRGQASPG
ncbi:helix-turn-helix domain-containing protein [Niveispirillum sp.]|uniref:helix-turn-helix domain-containing protein n=1 Tax=Niveispirillum sp. TaxID=1917217 RepID=UPI001B520DC6|nr:helix-turn-helix domain-containing protein [Niveispirillum sp.]MBP7338300.1 helix-turn-helix domain-containing protein [Niveispirillum sp.]